MTTARERAVAEIRARRMFGLAKRPRLRLPVQHPPVALELEYTRAVQALVCPRVEDALAPVRAALPDILRDAARARRGDRMDADSGRRLRELLDAARTRLRGAVSTERVEELAREFAAKTLTYQRIQLGRQVEAALGVNILGGDRKLAGAVEVFADANARLIQSIGEKVIAQVEAAALNAMQTGQLFDDLAPALEKIGFGAERAEIIARDQVGKLYGQTNALRQRELGIERFIWRSVRDERVRDLHATLNGKEFTYDDGGHPTEGLPGEPILCRCYAEPVFDDLDEDLADEDAEEPDDV